MGLSETLQEELAEARRELARYAEIASKAVTFKISDDVYIESRGPNIWAVTDGGRGVYSREGVREYEPMPSSRSDEFLARTRFPFAEAWMIAAEVEARRQR